MSTANQNVPETPETPESPPDAPAPLKKSGQIDNRVAALILLIVAALIVAAYNLMIKDPPKLSPEDTMRMMKGGGKKP